MATAEPSILIVDDEPANLRLLSAMLDERGFLVRFATGGCTALNSVRAKAPNLILLDIDMPDLSGYDVCRQLKDAADVPDVPILFISAVQDTEAKVRSFEVGGVDYISKPFQEEEVLARIDHQLTIHRQRAQIEAQAERLRELDTLKSRFFTAISHDFRTPLMLTKGLVRDVLNKRHGPLPSKAQGELERALLHADRLEELVEQILDLNKLEAGAVHLERHPLNVAGLMRQLAEKFAPLAERANVTLNVEAPVTPLVIDADAEALTKVITNLLSNACKHTPGGRVTMRLAVEDDTAHLLVEDTGCGIPPDVLPHVFERFYHHDESAKRHRTGTGMGLALAHDLVELHGGTLTAESTVGQGSTFTATLPHSVVDAGEMQPPREVPADVRLGGLEADLLAAEPAASPTESDEKDRTTVLVADDNAEVRRYLRSHLATKYRVLEVADGREALHLAQEALPDLIISDVQMPRFDGLQLCEALKHDSRTDFIPVVLLTVQAEANARLEGLGMGADDYVAKPFDMKELIARVDNLITTQRRLRNHLSEIKPRSDFELLDAQKTDLDAEEIDFLHQLVETIDERLDDPDFTVTGLATALAKERTTLYRWLQRLLDQSPSDVIRSIRLQRAADLLVDRAGTISEIAYAVGFRSVQHFDRCFRNAYDITPTDFREQHQTAA